MYHENLNQDFHDTLHLTRYDKIGNLKLPWVVFCIFFNLHNAG